MLSFEYNFFFQCSLIESRICQKRTPASLYALQAQFMQIYDNLKISCVLLNFYLFLALVSQKLHLAVKIQ